MSNKVNNIYLKKRCLNSIVEQLKEFVKNLWIKGVCK